jgi:D-alanyl-D-alanine carboxypeptidase (penicillin-binding protein 5/6)
LLNWGYTQFDAVRLFELGKAVVTVPVWKGTAKEARLGGEAAVYAAVPKGEGDRLKTSIERTDPLIAPLTKGQRVGTLKITTAGGAPVSSLPLVVLEEVPQAGLMGRAWDALRLWMK